jgi:hypothetical protein
MTDGLERDDPKLLEQEMARLARSAKRVVWLNPLLRSIGSRLCRGDPYDASHTGEFRPVHNLRSLEDLAEALSYSARPSMPRGDGSGATERQCDERSRSYGAAGSRSLARPGKEGGACHRHRDLGLGAAAGRQQLVIDSAGNFVGSVSGGCVEGEVVSEAQDVIASELPKILSYGVADETAWKVGLACGGRIRIYVEPMSPPDRDVA